jgi:hypothetical protein
MARREKVVVDQARVHCWGLILKVLNRCSNIKVFVLYAVQTANVLLWLSAGRPTIKAMPNECRKAVTFASKLTCTPGLINLSAPQSTLGKLLCLVTPGVINSYKRNMKYMHRYNMYVYAYSVPL